MNAERMNKANATAKIEGSKEARPPGRVPAGISTEEDFYLLAVPTDGKRSAVQEGTDGSKHPAG